MSAPGNPMEGSFPWKRHFNKNKFRYERNVSGNPATIRKSAQRGAARVLSNFAFHVWNFGDLMSKKFAALLSGAVATGAVMASTPVFAAQNL